MLEKATPPKLGGVRGRQDQPSRGFLPHSGRGRRRYRGGLDRSSRPRLFGVRTPGGGVRAFSVTARVQYRIARADRSDVSHTPVRTTASGGGCRPPKRADLRCLSSLCITPLFSLRAEGNTACAVFHFRKRPSVKPRDEQSAEQEDSSAAVALDVLARVEDQRGSAGRTSPRDSRPPARRRGGALAAASRGYAPAEPSAVAPVSPAAPAASPRAPPRRAAQRPARGSD